MDSYSQRKNTEVPRMRLSREDPKRSQVILKVFPYQIQPQSDHQHQSREHRVALISGSSLLAPVDLQQRQSLYTQCHFP